MSQDLGSTKPLPVPDEHSQPFFDAAARGQLLLRHCLDCRAFLMPDARFCCECLSEQLDWKTASGRASLHTFGIVHQAVPGWENEVPFIVSVVELEEGPRMTSTVTNTPSQELK